MNPWNTSTPKEELSSHCADDAHARGLAYQRAGDLKAAAKAYREALALEPTRVRSLNNLAALTMQQGELKTAETFLNRAEQQPSTEEEQALLVNTRSQLFCRQHLPEKAIQNCRQLALSTPKRLNWSNLALALSDANRSSAAERCQRLALGLKPGDDARSLLWKPAGSAQASAQQHQLLQNLAVLQLRRDPWCQEHWQLLEARLGTRPEAWNPDTNQPAPSRRLWRGEHVDQLLLWDEQGFGDAFQCLRWIPLALQRCRRLTLLLRPGLLRFVDHWLNQQPGDAEVSLEEFEPGQRQPWDQGATHCPLMSLPVAMALNGKSDLSQIDDEPVTTAINWPDCGRIGLVWAAGHKHEPDARTRSEQRSLPAATLVQLLNTLFNEHWRGGNISLINFQADREIPNHPYLQQYLNQYEPCRDWLSTSQKFKNLDGLITVDTAIAHLAGILGLPTILMLNRPCDWRWGDDGDRSNWYPSVKILRMNGNQKQTINIFITKQSPETLHSLKLLGKHIANNVDDRARTQTNIC